MPNKSLHLSQKRMTFLMLRRVSRSRTYANFQNSGNVQTLDSHNFIIFMWIKFETLYITHIWYPFRRYTRNQKSNHATFYFELERENKYMKTLVPSAVEGREVSWYSCRLGIFLTKLWTINGPIFKNFQPKEFLGERKKL